MNTRYNKSRWSRALILLSLMGIAQSALSAAPVVKVVPAVPSDPTVAHDTWNGKQITLKGASDVPGAGVTYTYDWDFGDGSAHATGTVTNPYAIEATHTYNGQPVGQIFSATLKVTNSSNQTTSKNYLIRIDNQDLQTAAKVAIDEGLWYLHKTMNRYTDSGLDKGNWDDCSSYAGCGYTANDAANLTAFFVNGHLETTDPSDPYVDTVQRGMKSLFESLGPINIAAKTYYSDYGTTPVAGLQNLNPDINGNGIGLQQQTCYYWGCNSSDAGYQGGQIIDAIVASGNPNAVTVTGTVGNPVSKGVQGRRYSAIVEDLVEAYAWAQSYYGPYYGGWRYDLTNYPADSDNSTNQWAAIGMLAAEKWTAAAFPAALEPVTVPDWVKTANKNSITLTQYYNAQNPQDSSNGVFGYTNSTSPIWGSFAVTPSGMVQSVFDGIGRGVQLSGRFPFDLSETYYRNQFCNNPANGATSSPRAYYYGLFSFTKSMLLHNTNGVPGSDPITKFGPNRDFDWYGAEQSAGAQCDGVARTLVNAQNPAGYWYGHNYTGEQYYFETAWAIIMLNRTVFSSGVPVAVAKATPNPAVATGLVTLDGSGSFHQDPNKKLVGFLWTITDPNHNPNPYTLNGPKVTTSFSTVGNYPVTLKVSDNGNPVDDDTTNITVNVSLPPSPPTANAGGYYVFCPQNNKWFLDGSKSASNGMSEPGAPANYITAYNWTLVGYADPIPNEKVPDVTAIFNTKQAGLYTVQLTVTDNTKLSFPSSNLGNPVNLTSLPDTASVNLKDPADQSCKTLCVLNLNAPAAKAGVGVQLTWSDSQDGQVDHYNIYRSAANSPNGPFVNFAGSSKTKQFLDADRTLVAGQTYYYVVRSADTRDRVLCESAPKGVKIPGGR